MFSNRQISIWSITIAILLVFSTITGFYTLPQWVYYVLLGVMLVYVLLLERGGRRIQPLVLFFLVICSLSILLNQPPAYFKAWNRFLAFLIIVSSVGPLFYNDGIVRFRLQLLNSIMCVFVTMSVGSLVCYFLGINFFVRYNELLEIEAGRFSGLYNHSMVLGPMSGLAAIYLLASLLDKKKGRVILVLLFLACLASTLLSASRAAIGGCVVGMVASYLRFFRGHISKGVLIGAVIVGLLALSFPIWGDLTDFVFQKQEASMTRGEGILLTRQNMYLNRIKEIKEHPFTGVGFCCVDPSYTYVDVNTGKVEPGTSWLAVFSMTGLFGFISFLFIFIKGLKRARSIRDQQLSSMLFGCLSFYFLHLFFEGYVLAAGSMTALFFWLIMGCIWTSDSIE